MGVQSRLGKILIANRGEIACRIIRTARKLGVKTVAVYSDVDANSLHVEMADEAYNIGKSSAQESYLRGEKIIKVALNSGAAAIHPGYGFLSENAEFASYCLDSGLIFIGPPASAIRDMGIKSTSKKIIGDAGVRIIPGYHGSEQSENKLKIEAENIGYPLMIKAIRGGGGKGMRIVKKPSNFLSSLESARRESLRAFGDDAVLLERYIERPRHVEVQVFGDTHGNYVHLFERDCSIQRRHQKVIEQAPAPHITPEIRNELGQAGVQAAKAVGYVGAGTVEFILDTSDSAFYFMEMNTRLQVEHPVTEMVTGVDLVEWQLRVAAGEPLPKKQDELKLSGCAVEARIYAEGRDFMPTAGTLEALSVPNGDGIRVETGIREGDDVTVHYDPMIAKLIVWDPDEKDVFSKLDGALKEFNIVGVENNVDFLRSLSRNKNLIDGNVHTNFIEENKSDLLAVSPSEQVLSQAVMGLILYEDLQLKKEAISSVDKSPFSLLGPFRINHSYKRRFEFLYENKEIIVEAEYDNNQWYTLYMSGSNPIKICGEIVEDGNFLRLKLFTPKTTSTHKIAIRNDAVHVFDKDGDYKLAMPKDAFWEDSDELSGNKLEPVSPMPGIVEKINVNPGDIIKKGDSVAVVIAMKMEYVIKAEKEGKVKAVNFKPGDNVGKNIPIISIED